MCSSTAEAQVLDSIRYQYFYGLPFKRSATFEDVITSLDNRKDSFVLLEINRNARSRTAQYGTLFKDSFLKSQVRIDIWSNCREDTTLPCYMYFIRLVPGTIAPKDGDSTKMQFSYETGLSKKEKKKIFRSLNRSVYLRRQKLRKEWGKGMSRYKKKVLLMETIRYSNIYNGTNMLLLERFKWY